MNHRKSIILVTTSILLSFISIPIVRSESSLKSIFQNPPEAAKPRGYWVWPQGNFDYTRIAEELKAFKEIGLAGVDIYDMGVDDPYDIIPSGPAFFSNEQLDGIVYALKCAKELDLKIGMSVSNGWNAGGDWTTPDEMSMNTLFWQDTIQGPVELKTIGFPTLPTQLKKLYGIFPLYPQIGKDGLPLFFEDISLIAYPFSQFGIISDPKQIITYNTNQINGNKVDGIRIPEGKWVIQRAVVTPIGQRMWAASDNSKGYIMDHFSEKATHHHFTYLFDKLENRLGNLRNTALERLYLASFESEAAVEWTPFLNKFFYELNGYRIEPFIPALNGQIIVNKDITNRFLYDYRHAISEMFVKNHYLQARKMCHDHGLLLASESGGPGAPLHKIPTEDYKALGAVDIMRGEFWNMKNMHKDRNGGELLTVIKNIAGAAHTYGRKIVEMEAFTSQGKHWRENPTDLKKLADYAFCNGMTRVIYHTIPHSPKEGGMPGWSYGAGTHYSPNLTWWSLSKPLNDYFSRISAVLQQGQFVADVAYYKGEDIPNLSIGYKYEKPTLGKGYDYDDINTEILLQIKDVVNGKIVLPCGMSYSILVIPYMDTMNPNVVSKLIELVEKGAIVLANKPTKVFGLHNYVERESELKQLSDYLWGKNYKTKQIRKFGKGYIITGYTEKEILQKNKIIPDFISQTDTKSKQLNYIHRSTDTEEIYFISNSDSLLVNTQIDFRVSRMQPQLWNPYTGEIEVCKDFQHTAKTTTLQLQLDPYESIFVIFSKQDTNYVFANEISSGRNINKENTNASNEFQLKGTWDVRFSQGWGFNPIQRMDTLVDWVKHSETAINHYSGSASYKLAFTLPADFISDEKKYELVLGKVGEVARVFLNGREIGISLFEPHKFDLKNVLREGENNIVIEVANTWLNQYLYDINKSKFEQRLSSNVEKKEFIRFGSEPIPSGLMGPVRIIAHGTN